MRLGQKCVLNDGDVIDVNVMDENKSRIQKRFALSPRLFSKATEMISVISKSVSPVNNIETLSLYLQNHKNTFKNSCESKYRI